MLDDLGHSSGGDFALVGKNEVVASRSLGDIGKQATSQHGFSAEEIFEEIGDAVVVVVCIRSAGMCD